MTAHLEQLSASAAEAATALATAHKETAEALYSLEDYRWALSDLETHVTLRGLEGPNEAARKAYLTDATRKERSDVLAAEQDLIRARGRLEQAKVRFRAIELTVEIAKLAEGR